jgi:hypothetical protein
LHLFLSILGRRRRISRHAIHSAGWRVFSICRTGRADGLTGVTRRRAAPASWADLPPVLHGPACAVAMLKIIAAQPPRMSCFIIMCLSLVLSFHEQRLLRHLRINEKLS